MTRLAIILIVFCTLMGAGCFFWKLNAVKQVVIEPESVEATENAIKAKLNQDGNVMYALRDIRQGAVITASDIEQRVVPELDVFSSTILVPSLAVGMKARHPLRHGQIVSDHDLEHYAERYTRPYSKQLNQMLHRRGKSHEISIDQVNSVK